ncbi:MAG: hypothetical protein O9318_06730 [Hylemonella sp.]|uniref:hypothetical protein n=1 Tax=Hylemonella sp. TaxID=2066020 RepID=UPI0022BC4D56|nr:hypothetical protein [Hylemonella sp.]MCZ8252146.1 hypothetical protein [Hylemonella sp.]
MNTAAAYYESLFAPLVAEVGPLGEATATGVVGFSAGGPVSMVQAGVRGYMTCELSLYPEQRLSAEGDHYELLCRLALSASQAQALLTGLGRLSMEATLGHGHTIDVTALKAAPGLSVITLRHYASVLVEEKRCSIYEVTSE